MTIPIPPLQFGGPSSAAATSDVMGLSFLNGQPGGSGYSVRNTYSVGNSPFNVAGTSNNALNPVVLVGIGLIVLVLLIKRTK